MSVTQPNINQFAQTTVQGQLDLLFPGGVISGQVDSTQAVPLIAGQAVKMTSTSGGLPKFVGLTSNSDKTFGFVSRNLKDVSFPAYSNFELAWTDSVMWMSSGAAISRNSNVEVVFSSNTVITSAGFNPVIGIALDTATGSGQLIRVLIKTPMVGALEPVQELTVTATLAQINAGLVLIPGAVGKSINVSDFIARVAGNFATGTSVELESTNASPVAAVTFLEAALTTGAVLVPGSANVTLGAGYGAPMGSGDGLQVVNNGSAQTGGTSITFTITYQQV